jgi:ATP-binding protein involved in chromosome partitioning
MNEDDIRAVLAPFNLGKMLDGLHVGDGLVQVTLAIKREDAAALEPMRRDVEAAVAKLPGVKNASVVFTAHKAPPPPPPAAAAVLPEVKAVIAVASGKGGVEIHRGGEFGGGAGAEWFGRGFAGCGYLWAFAAAHAGVEP